MQAKSNGWRNHSTIQRSPIPPHTHEKTDLFKAYRVAVRAMNLKSGARFVLENLCAAYGGQAIGSKILVWPSNKWLADKTGLSERSIRYHLAAMRRAGLIHCHDSPNGKRYARRDTQRQITTAYGFDLSPLLARLAEFKDILARRAVDARKHAEVFDAITIHRRSVQEALRTLEADFADTDTSEHQRRYQALCSALPRRSSKETPYDAARLWKELRAEVDALYLAASGSENCRHKDTDTYSEETPCSKRSDDVAQLVSQCYPDAVDLIGRPRCDVEIFELSSRQRGMLGVSHSAWLEARQQLGDTGAGALVYQLVQQQARPKPGSPEIRNLGGYLRAMVRVISRRPDRCRYHLPDRVLP